MIHLLVADDHQIILDGFIGIFQNDDSISITATAKNGKEVLSLVDQVAVDVIILDINMPGFNGVEVCKQLSKKYPQIPVIALSMYKRASYIQRMMQYGAKGYLLKDDSAEEITNAILTVSRGDYFFSSQIDPALLLFSKKAIQDGNQEVSDRETEVLELISEGLTNSEISKKLFISQHTAESHRKNLLAKLDAKNTAELVKIAMEKGLI